MKILLMIVITLSRELDMFKCRDILVAVTQAAAGAV